MLTKLVFHVKNLPFTFWSAVKGVIFEEILKGDVLFSFVPKSGTFHEAAGRV